MDFLNDIQNFDRPTNLVALCSTDRTIFLITQHAVSDGAFEAQNVRTRLISNDISQVAETDRTFVLLIPDVHASCL